MCSLCERAKAYNGACTALITKNGASIPSSTGMVRLETVISDKHDRAPSLFPDLNQYWGPPLEFGRMEASVSDPSVQLQVDFAGIPDAGQVNALETLNIRGERSVTCKGDFERAPSAGPCRPEPGSMRRVS